jgi:hypothetical protein
MLIFEKINAESFLLRWSDVFDRDQKTTVMDSYLATSADHISRFLERRDMR